MVQSSLSRKLGIKQGHRILVINEPEGYKATLGALPEDVEIETSASGECDFVQAFVRDKAGIDSLASVAMGALKKGGLLWFSYPKKSSKVKTDITRDTGWDSLREADMRPVSQVSVDDTWSALRFRPVADVKPRR